MGYLERLMKFNEITAENYEAAKIELMSMLTGTGFNPEFAELSDKVCSYEAKNDLQYPED